MWKVWILQCVFFVSLSCAPQLRFQLRLEKNMRSLFQEEDPYESFKRHLKRRLRLRMKGRHRALLALPTAIHKPTSHQTVQPTAQRTTHSTVQSTGLPTTCPTSSTSQNNFTTSSYQSKIIDIDFEKHPPQTTQPTTLVLQSTFLPRLNEIRVDIFVVIMGFFGFTAFILNSFVICRIIFKIMSSKIHQTNYFFLSLAFADAYYGMFCFVYTLIRFDVVEIEDTFRNLQIEKIWRETSAILSLNSSLYHVLIITLDRYIATAFPLFHKVHITRCKISIVIIISWLLAVLLAILPLCIKSNLISDWFYIIVGCCGLFLLIVTYTHIIIVIIKRWRQLKKQRHMKRNTGKKTDKSKSTTFISISITITYICCIVIAFLYQTNVVQGVYIKFLLFSINATLNPMFYTIVEYVCGLAQKRSKENEPLQKH